MREFDVVVIGAGVAGLTAAMTAARLGPSVGVIERLSPGGQIMNARRIDNWPGSPAGLAGIELATQLFEQATAAGAEVILDSVTGLDSDGDRHVVHGGEDGYRARAVIIAAGSRRRLLGIPGAARLMAKGVSHCASCDGPLYRGKHVAVVGGGDSALDEALSLAEFVGAVTIFHRGRRLDGQHALIGRVSRTANIEVRLDCVIEEIIGDSAVDSVRVSDSRTGASAVQPVAAVFIYVGLAPDTEFLGDVIALDADGRIVTDPMMATSRAGVFAAGDIRSGSVALLAAVAGDGATAAIAAWRNIGRER